MDDEAATRTLLTRALEKRGFVVESVATGREALARLENAPPALVVLDFDLPDMNGEAICRQLRDDERAELAELPIVLLTAHAGEEEELRCLSAGANDFVTKPVSVAVLEARIRTQLRLRAMRAELQQQNAELEEWRRVRELDLNAAQATQRALIPSRLPRLAGWEVATHYQPLIEVGGDAYGWEPLECGHWLFWIADATGHGASAALLTALARVIFQHAGSVSKSPAEILRLVNQDLFAVCGGQTFMTAACAVLRPGHSGIAWSSAGHPPLLVARADGGVERVEAGSLLLGMSENLDTTEATVALAPGDVALLYTDGLFSGTKAGGQRMSLDDLTAGFAARSRAASTLEATMRGLAGAAAGAGFDDDVAVIALQRV